MKFEDVYTSCNILECTDARILFEEISSCVHLAGDTAEVGVYQGHNSKVIKLLAPDKCHFCYDTFSGIVDSNAALGDVHQDGEFACSLEAVKQRVGCENVVYKVGFFPDTFEEHGRTFCFVYIDVATFSGTQNALLRFNEHVMTAGGKLVVYLDSNCSEELRQLVVDSARSRDGQFKLTVKRKFYIMEKLHPPYSVNSEGC